MNLLSAVSVMSEAIDMHSAEAIDQANRLQSNDPKIRQAAERELMDSLSEEDRNLMESAMEGYNSMVESGELYGDESNDERLWRETRSGLKWELHTRGIKYGDKAPREVVEAAYADYVRIFMASNPGADEMSFIFEEMFFGLADEFVLEEEAGGEIGGEGGGEAPLAENEVLGAAPPVSEGDAADAAAWAAATAENAALRRGNAEFQVPTRENARLTALNASYTAELAELREQA